MSSFTVTKTGDFSYELVITEPVINATIAEELKVELYNLLDKKAKNVKVDLSKVERIGSNGIGKLLLFYKKLQEDGGQLHIHGLNSEISKTFHLLKLDNLFNIS